MGFKDLLFGQQMHVENAYKEYLDQWKKCTDSYAKAMQLFFEEGNTEQFAFWVHNTHKMESKADDLRRDIEIQLYSKALLPESRGDILGVLETIDKVINKVESVLFQIHLEDLTPPKQIHNFLDRITTITVECLEVVHEAAQCFFNPREDMMKLAELIDQKESECDHVEREALKVLFASDLDWHIKFQVKNLIIEMGNITDRAETVSDRLVITSIKRRV